MSDFNNGCALIIGIANYPNVRRLPNTVLQDARDVSCRHQEAFQMLSIRFSKCDITYLSDSNVN